jgi:hypothetical protein
MKCTLDSGGKTQTLYLRNPANTSYSGTYMRAPFTSSQDLAGQTASGNVFIFTGLSTSDAAVTLEPASSSPGAVVGIAGVRLVPAGRVQTLVPRITGPLAVSAIPNTQFSCTIQADTLVTSYGATGLPTGLAIDPVTGRISGRPAAIGTYLVSLSASNAAGTATETCSFEVVYPPTESVELTLFMVPGLLVPGTSAKITSLKHPMTSVAQAIGERSLPCL